MNRYSDDLLALLFTDEPLEFWYEWNELVDRILLGYSAPEDYWGPFIGSSIGDIKDAIGEAAYLEENMYFYDTIYFINDRIQWYFDD
jgi:hypothetical protein